MPDYGVPTSINRTYANPSSTIDSILNVIPTEQRIGLESRNTDIRERATNAQIAQDQQRLELAKLAEERNQKVAEQEINRAKLQNALETALFQDKIDAQKALARRTVLEANLASRDYERQDVNEPILAGITNDLANADHEALARGDLDEDFNGRIKSLKGLDAQTKARAAFDTAKKQSFDLIHAANVEEFDPDLREQFTTEWQAAARGSKPWVFEKYRNRQSERNLAQQADQWNEAVRFDAPSLLIDVPNKFTLPDGRINVPGLKAALNQAQALYTKDKADVTAAVAQDKALLDEKTKTRDTRLRSLETGISNIRDNLTKVGVARAKGSGDQTLAFLLGAVDGGKTPMPTSDEDRKKVLDGIESSLNTQLKAAQDERDSLTKEAPHQDLDRKILDLQTEVLTNTRIIKDPTATKQAKDEAAKKVAAARQSFEKWLGRPGAAKYYDGTMRYNPFLPALQGSTAFGGN